MKLLEYFCGLFHWQAGTYSDCNAFPDSGIKVDDYKPPHRGPSNEWLSGTDMAEEQFHEVDELSNPKEYSRNDYRSNRNLQIPMVRFYSLY